MRRRRYSARQPTFWQGLNLLIAPTQATLLSLSTEYSFWVYLLVLPLSCAEGPILSVLFGVLLKFGYFSFVPVYAALMAGDLMGDAFWYYVGRRYGYRFVAKFGKYVSISEESVGKVMRLFGTYQHRILILSKLTNGFGFALVTLVAAGMIRIPFGKYLLINLLGQAVWTGFLLSVGYCFSHLYLQFDGWFGRASVVAGSLVAFALVVGYVKQVITQSDPAEQS